ncbi:DnaJ domain-containing protein [Candidatus Woesearchaeota archaeon]|nr:DnaJ domain-containing protein [Candidatus Woesearchaeota archaeon]
MAAIKVKGHEFAAVVIKDSFDRRALQYKNKIITTLRKIGLTADDIDVELEANAAKNAPASASWYIDGHHLHFSYKSGRKYVENLYIVLKVIELEANALLAGQRTQEEFIREFSEDKDFEHKRKEARETLGVAPDVLDIKHIDSSYKALAKKYHPDMPGGNAEKFKKINHAHKILKRELQ